MTSTKTIAPSPTTTHLADSLTEDTPSIGVKHIWSIPPIVYG